MRPDKQIMEIDNRLRGPEYDKYRAKWECYMHQYGLNYVWEVKDHVSGIDEDELREGILVVYGTVIYNHYHWYISTAYAINAAPDKWHITARLLQTIGYLYNSYEDENEGDRERARVDAKDYIMNLKSVCSHYGVTIDGWRMQAVDDCDKALQVIVDRDNEDWSVCLKDIICGTQELAECVERSDFIHCLRFEYKNVDLLLCRVAPYLIGLNNQQKKWLAEYEASAVKSQQAEAETEASAAKSQRAETETEASAAKSQRAETETEASAATTPPAMTPRQRLPQKLDTPQARQYFEQAVKAGLLDSEYNWMGESDVLLSCFCAGMSLALKLGKGEKDNKPYISWKPFEKVFDKGNLHGHFKEVLRSYTPIGIEEIYKIFPDLKEYLYPE